MKKWLAVLLALILALGSAAAAMAEETWTCPECGAENSKNFCTSCGAARPAAAAALTECPNCHAELDPANPGNFCFSCGFDLRTAGAEPGGDQPARIRQVEWEGLPDWTDPTPVPEGTNSVVTEPVEPEPAAGSEPDHTPIGDKVLISATAEAGGSAAEVLRGSVLVPNQQGGFRAEISLVDGEHTQDFGLYADENQIMFMNGQDGAGSWNLLEDGNGNALSPQGILNSLTSQMSQMSMDGLPIEAASEAVGKIIQENLPLLKLEENMKEYSGGRAVIEIGSADLKAFLKAVLEGIAADPEVGRLMTEMNAKFAPMGMDMNLTGWQEELRSAAGSLDEMDEDPFTLRAVVDEKSVMLTIKDSKGTEEHVDLVLNIPFSQIMKSLRFIQRAPVRASFRAYAVDADGFRTDYTDLSLTADPYYTNSDQETGIRWLLDGKLSNGRLLRAEWKAGSQRGTGTRTYSAEITMNGMTIFRGSLNWTQTYDGLTAALHIDQINSLTVRNGIRLSNLDIVLSGQRRGDGLDGSLTATMGEHQLIALALKVDKAEGGFTAAVTADGELIGSAAGTYTLNGKLEGQDDLILNFSADSSALQGAVTLKLMHSILEAYEWAAPVPAGSVPFALN